MPDAPFREASPLARFSWAMFDWSNQPFFTIITTFIFAPYFSTIVVGDAIRGQSLWGYTQSVSGLIIALGSPFLGAMADASGRRKPWILAFQLLVMLGCAMLWWAAPGRDHLIGFIMIAVVIATIGAEFSIIFNNALLPTLVAPERLGRLSGLGWGMGYTGGLVSLFAVLIVSRPELIGIVPPEGQALFGLDRATYAAERMTGPASAIWLALFVLPMFLFTPDTPHRGRSAVQAARHGARQLLHTLRALRRYRNPATFLLAFMLYNDGLNAVIAFGGIYAAGNFNWSTTELGLFGIIITIFATIGSFTGGWLDDRLGSRLTILVSIVGVMVATLGIISVNADHVLFFVAVAPQVDGDGLFAASPEQVFLLFSILLGIFMGPMQAASRTMTGRLAPPSMVGEFYGLFALSGKATAFMAPLAIAIFTEIFASQRAAGAVVLVFLLVGFVLLLRVREERAADLPLR